MWRFIKYDLEEIDTLRRVVIRVFISDGIHSECVFLYFKTFPTSLQVYNETYKIINIKNTPIEEEE